MLRSMKKIRFKNLPYYFFNYRINIKNFDPSLLEINKLSFKSTNTNIYHIEYITMRSFDHVNIDSENPLCLTFNNVDGYIEENNGDKYLIFASTNNNKGVLEKYTKIWNETKNKIKTRDGDEPINCKKDLFFKKTLSTSYLQRSYLSADIIIITRFYRQVYLHECL